MSTWIKSFILAFCTNCLGPLIQEEDKVDELIKKFQEDNMDNEIFANMPDDFMADLDEDEDPIEDEDEYVQGSILCL